MLQDLENPVCRARVHLIHGPGWKGEERNPAPYLVAIDAIPSVTPTGRINDKTLLARAVADDFGQLVAVGSWS